MAANHGTVVMTPEILTQICQRIMDGDSVRRICLEDGMPCRRTLYQYLEEQPFAAAQYARAKEIAADLMAEEIIELSDDVNQDPNRSRLQVDARKWVASKLKPKKYGDKILNEHTGPDGGPVQVITRIPDPALKTDAAGR